MFSPPVCPCPASSPCEDVPGWVVFIVISLTPDFGLVRAVLVIFVCLASPLLGLSMKYESS